MNANISSGIGEVADLAQTIVARIWPDKTAEEQAQLAATLTVVKGQLDANTAAAAQPGMHFRDGAGWVCVVGMGMNVIVRPLIQWGAVAFGHPLDFPELDSSTLTPMLMSLLGLGGLHVYEQVKNK